MKAEKRPSALQLPEREFLECRSRLLEVAALFDRIDRYLDAQAARRDFRYLALQGTVEGIRAGEEMQRRGFDRRQVSRLLYDNPVAFRSQSPRFQPC